MATKNQTESAPSEEVTLDEFCARQSATDKRVELIKGFHFTEQRAGVVKDTESNFASRYVAFANQPV